MDAKRVNRNEMAQILSPQALSLLKVFKEKGIRVIKIKSVTSNKIWNRGKI